MSDTQAIGQQQRAGDWGSNDARRRVRRRYAADWRLQAYGIIAIGLAVGLLGILIRNIVDNAVRHGVAGGTIRVDVLRDSGTVRLVVTDEGPGIPAAHRQALGERFYRVPGSQEPGTGLGLSIVRRIAQLHRAGVEFRDGPGGRGLSVVVEFPAA